MTPESIINPEQKHSSESPVRVYPMGFIPEVKRTLIEFADQELMRLKGASEVGEQLRSAVEKLNLGESELHDFLEKVRQLDELVKDGEPALRKEKEFITHALRTDEELAVIFARVSRTPGAFEELARTVTEEGAGQFHKQWTVSIEGYGHASVAEHAVIHLAVENVPSLDGDVITDNRLAAYTEFSARFRGPQGVGYFTPESVERNSSLLNRWQEVHGLLFQTHDALVEKGLAYIDTEEAREKHPARRVNIKTVSDQFKNLMPASRLTNIGVTMNAREAENAIRKMLSSPYPSVQNLGALFKEQALRVSPTLVRYAEKNEYLVMARQGIGKIAESEKYKGYIPEIKEEGQLVDLIDFDRRADEKFIAAALYSASETGSFRELLGQIEKEMDEAQKREKVEILLGGLDRWDVPIRELEMPGDYLVEFPGMTYGDWREYKRHRMQSYIVKDFDVKWGFMIPPLAPEMDESKDPQFHGCTQMIKRAMGEVEKLFTEVSRVDPRAAHYAVTRLHYRPAIAKFNIREAYHLINLRTGSGAHPFIRRLMWPLLEEIKEVQPILMDYLRLKMQKTRRPAKDFPWSL